jgi:hypothetical protein
MIKEQKQMRVFDTDVNENPMGGRLSFRNTIRMPGSVNKFRPSTLVIKEEDEDDREQPNQIGRATN